MADQKGYSRRGGQYVGEDPENVWIENSQGQPVAIPKKGMPEARLRALRESVKNEGVTEIKTADGPATVYKDPQTGAVTYGLSGTGQGSAIAQSQGRPLLERARTAVAGLFADSSPIMRLVGESPAQAAPPPVAPARTPHPDAGQDAANRLYGRMRYKGGDHTPGMMATPEEVQALMQGERLDSRKQIPFDALPEALQKIYWESKASPGEPEGYPVGDLQPDELNLLRALFRQAR